MWKVDTLRSVLLATLMFIMATSQGCKEETVGVPHTHQPAAEADICGLCGELKSSAHSCRENAERCKQCGLIKDLILCCSDAIRGASDVILCRKCGEVAFSVDCCKEGTERCEKCGLVEDSPGCCKIKPFDPNAPEAEATESHAHE